MEHHGSVILTVRPKADTSVPVLVHDVRYEQPQSLQPEESEMLLGYPPGATAGCAVTPIQQLRSLGDLWDSCTALMLNRFSRHATIRIEGQMCNKCAQCAQCAQWL